MVERVHRAHSGEHEVSNVRGGEEITFSALVFDHRTGWCFQKNHRPRTINSEENRSHFKYCFEHCHKYTYRQKETLVRSASIIKTNQTVFFSRKKKLFSFTIFKKLSNYYWFMKFLVYRYFHRTQDFPQRNLGDLQPTIVLRTLFWISTAERRFFVFTEEGAGVAARARAISHI